VTIETWRTVNEEVHLSFPSSFQYSFEAVNTRLINIILRELIPSAYNSFWEEIFPDVELTPVFRNLPRVSLSSAARIWWIIRPSIWILPADQLYCDAAQVTINRVVLCEYSKFRIESNSYLLFDSIRNWRNYSKFSNTYLTVISRAIDKRFVCTLPATSCRTHLSVEPSAAPREFLPLPLPECPDHACTHAWEVAAPVRACSQRQVSTMTSDGVITAGGKHSAQSVERWTFCQYWYGFNFNTETCCI